MIVMNGEEFLTAQEACALLGVKAATLYAYVSRGLLGSYRQGIRRTRLYRRSEIEHLTRLHRPEADDGQSNRFEAHPSAQDDADEPGESNEQDGHKWIPYV
ncbi:MAG TPA: helix-turn-helix domain-containing protein [Ktedonobacterales bacterium]|nr:helix-turn-helix domain-containing protein [Ktedonobacterales bacterium]